jgi:hypothetical protein
MSMGPGYMTVAEAKRARRPLDVLGQEAPGKWSARVRGTTGSVLIYDPRRWHLVRRGGLPAGLLPRKGCIGCSDGVGADSAEKPSGLKMALAVGSLGLLGVGLYYGLTTKSRGMRVYRWT